MSDEPLPQSEIILYQKVLDIYATSVDYTPDAEASQKFFATVQNKMRWATHGHTAAEVIVERAEFPPTRHGRKRNRNMPSIAPCWMPRRAQWTRILKKRRRI